MSQTGQRRLDWVKRMRKSRPVLFCGRHFREEIIVLCVRWYLRYPLSYCNLEEMMAKRNLTVDHSMIRALGFFALRSHSGEVDSTGDASA